MHLFLQACKSVILDALFFTDLGLWWCQWEPYVRTKHIYVCIRLSFCTYYTLWSRFIACSRCRYSLHLILVILQLPYSNSSVTHARYYFPLRFRIICNFSLWSSGIRHCEVNWNVPTIYERLLNTSSEFKCCKWILLWDVRSISFLQNNGSPVPEHKAPSSRCPQFKPCCTSYSNFFSAPLPLAEHCGPGAQS
jgi:hypothetical protein